MPLDALAFAVNMCRLAAPDGVSVDATADVDTVDRLPVALVQTHAPQSVVNGPNAAASTFQIVVSVHAGRRAEASGIAHEMYGRLVEMWRSRTLGRHGGFVHIRNRSQMPFMVDSALNADGVHRFDFTLDVVARARP